MGSLIPTELTWAAISTDISTVMANALVIALISFGIGVRIVPKFVRMLKSVTR